jgi:hypothetical protein
MTKMRSQKGATLVIALIMLVLLTLFALSALNSSTTNLKVVGNMQTRSEALNAAQQVIEATISSTQFTTANFATATNPVLNPCGGPDTLCVDAAGNFGTVPTAPGVLYTIQLTPKPACITVRSIKTSELSLTSPADLACTTGQAQQFGVGGAVTGDSLCANSVWQVNAETTVVATSAKAANIVQGIGTRISTDDMVTSCL